MAAPAPTAPCSAHPDASRSAGPVLPGRDEKGQCDPAAGAARRRALCPGDPDQRGRRCAPFEPFAPWIQTHRAAGGALPAGPYRASPPPVPRPPRAAVPPLSALWGSAGLIGTHAVRVGILALTGNIQWKTFGGIAIGASIIFGAPAIVTYLQTLAAA